MSLESLIVWVIVGGIAGTIADWLVSGVRLGCLGTVVVGIIGAFVGAWLLQQLNLSIGSGLINDIVTAAIGATVLLLGIRFLRRI
ncbi:MAG TPA: GlsB/YeaQ/YmgE family stress response membrane protein [Anaerolineae bacterium]|nr:GlsB/YeaQ/YmgE family stress response membrane protein [Anaerolineae bacterium]HRJ55047.1 GlsB/YeaQ/YmgE family stress response membrane protein [Anaerolineales bacterium]